VHDVTNNGLANPIMSEIYLPYSLVGGSNTPVRTTLDPSALIKAVSSQVRDRQQSACHQREDVDALLAEDEFSTPRFNLILLSVFAAIGLVLAVVGVRRHGNGSRATTPGDRRADGARRHFTLDRRHDPYAGLAPSAPRDGDRIGRKRRRREAARAASVERLAV
jgi:hypothetical protein